MCLSIKPRSAEPLTFEAFVAQARRTGRIFSVEFKTRGSNSIRRMLCRCGVRKGTQGKSMGYNPSDYGLLLVYDMHNKGFRSLPVENIITLVFNGLRYTRNPDAWEFIPE